MNIENKELKELKSKIGECLYNIESGTFDHWKICYTPHCLKSGQKTEGQKLVELSRERLYLLIDDFFINSKEKQ